MKDNIMLRLRYFALYWGQEVGRKMKARDSWKFRVNEIHLSTIDYIVLKPYMEELDLDQQRALGHATPYMNYSLEDLIQAGWLRIEG